MTLASTAHVRRPNDLSGVLLHPGAVAAMGVLLVNDHMLKQMFPGTITGKLSDVAGLVFFPLLLVTAAECVRWSAGRGRPYTESELAWSIVIAGVGFGAVKLSAELAGAYSFCLGLIRWPLRSVSSVLAGSPVPDVAPVIVIADPADLVALPALALGWWIGRRRACPDRLLT